MASNEKRQEPGPGHQPGPGARSGLPGWGGLPEPVQLTSSDGAGAAAGVLAGVGSRADCAPGAGHTALTVLRGAAGSVRAVGEASAQLVESDLDEAARLLLAAREDGERSLVLVLADAMARGVVAASDSGGGRQWLTDRAGRLEPAAASRVVAAAEAINRPENTAVRAALVSGAVSADAVVVALREAPQAMVALPDASRDEVLGYYLAVAQAGGGRKELRRLTRQIIARFGDGRAERDERRAQDVETVSWQELPSGLMELIAILSPGHAAQVMDAITALAAPQPTADPDTGEEVRDPRPPGKRRADALMEIVGLAARADDGHAARSSATLVLTMGLADLIGTPDHPGGGFGVTATGQVIDAGTARRMACSADIIPVVLGTDSAPLDVGRTRRLFTGGVRTAIITRDKQCSFPGCDRPPGWCEAHHITPWWVGGETSVENGTLLCSRHHHVVHSRGYTATVTGDGVHWDLTEGRMRRHRTPRQDAA